MVSLLGFGLDMTGQSILGLSTNWGLTALFAFGVAILITFVREIDSAQQPRPRVKYAGLSPATVSMPALYFARLLFQNKSKTPFGRTSTAQELTASIAVRSKQAVVDEWDGRWANTDRPTTTGDIWKLNKLDLPANTQQATLDIGYRVEATLEFKGWDNLHYFEDKRVPIKPGHYVLQVKLGAANWKQRDFWFTLDIPNEPQSSDLNQVQIKSVKKSAIRKAGFQI